MIPSEQPKQFAAQTASDMAVEYRIAEDRIENNGLIEEETK
jgi:hypothetical protein